jgi:phage tail sheath protein FI
MAILLSPGVYSSEKDISDIVPTVASASAAIVGYSAKGSTADITLITSDKQFIEEYGEPDPSSGHYFHYAALAYLAQGNTLYCLRVASGALYGGVNIIRSDSSTANAAITTGKSTATFGVSTGLSVVLFQIIGKDPGVWNNKIRVKIQNVKTVSDEVISDRYTFEIVVYYEDDDGTDQELEKFQVSRQTKVDGFGKDLYLEDRVNGISQYIQVFDNTTIENTILPKVQATALDFACGSDGSAISSGELITGWDEFANPDDIDIRILINGGETATAVQSNMQAIAEDRADCIAVLDMPWLSVQDPTDMLTFRSTTQNINSNYCALYAPWVQIYDSYNDKLIYVPPSGHVAAQMAYNDYVANPWDAPAGFNRGILNVISTSYVFTQGERDTLYPVQINPIQLFRGEGIAIWGQKTLQKKMSALSSVNVRRLLIVIEKAMAISLRSFLFEPNDEITRFRVVALLEEYLDRLSAQGAFQKEGGDKGYHVLCSATNNTPAVIDSNQMNVDVFIKPIRAAEYIKLQSIITSTGASFEELVARGIMW